MKKERRLPLFFHKYFGCVLLLFRKASAAMRICAERATAVAYGKAWEIDLYIF